MKEKPPTLSVKSIKKNLKLHADLGPGDSVIVAISGGPDSVALLHILAHLDLQLNLTGVYINHQLRPEEIPREIELVSTLCRRLNIPFLRQKVNVRSYMVEGGHSMEQAARTLRHRALEDIRKTKDAKYIAFGHTANDQVEEFFIRLLRGSAKKGLAGMQMVEEKRLRPLLHHNKNAILDYLRDHQLSYCSDSSNDDTSILRNHIRLNLLPFLEKNYNPSLRTTVLGTMEILTEEDRYLQKETETAFSACLNISTAFMETPHPEALELVLTTFNSFHCAIQRRIVEKCCWSMQTEPNSAQIIAVIDMAQNSPPSSELHLKGGLRIEKTTDTLRFSKPLPKGVTRGSQVAEGINLPIPEPGRYWVESRKQYLFLQKSTVDSGNLRPGTLKLDYHKIFFPLQLRSVAPGERFHPCNRAGTKKVARYFNEKKIPAKKRPHFPVLVDGIQVIAIPGVEQAHPFRVTSKTIEILEIWWEDEADRQK